MDPWGGKPRYWPGVDPVDVWRRNAAHRLRLKQALAKVKPARTVITVQYRAAYTLADLKGLA